MILPPAITDDDALDSRGLFPAHHDPDPDGPRKVAPPDGPCARCHKLVPPLIYGTPEGLEYYFCPMQDEADCMKRARAQAAEDAAREAQFAADMAKEAAQDAPEAGEQPQAPATGKATGPAGRRNARRLRPSKARDAALSQDEAAGDG